MVLLFLWEKKEERSEQIEVDVASEYSNLILSKHWLWSYIFINPCPFVRLKFMVYSKPFKWLPLNISCPHHLWFYIEEYKKSVAKHIWLA